MCQYDGISRPTKSGGGGGGGGGGRGTGDTFPGPPKFKGSHEALIFMIFTFLGCIFM